MADEAIFSLLRRRRSPSPQALLAPVDLNGAALVRALASISSELVSSFNGESFFFQRKNARSLLRRIEILKVLFEYFVESGSNLLPPANLCFKELYLLLYQSKILLEYCSQSRKVLLLIQNPLISGHFHDLNKEISTILDIFPMRDTDLIEDIREQIEFLHKQTRKSKLYLDKNDEALRIEFYSLLDGFEKGKVPSPGELRSFFVEKLEIRDSQSCRAEVAHLEEQIAIHEGNIEPHACVLNAFVAVARYCRFLLFGFEEEGIVLRIENQKRLGESSVTAEISDKLTVVPKDFCCPISLDLMRDPVIISTGQTYDRSSISRWIAEGHYTCPKTGQALTHLEMFENRALKNLIMQWCNANSVPYESGYADSLKETLASASPSKSEREANKATVLLLIQTLANGSEAAKTVAAHEIRLLAKTAKENRALVGEAGAIPHLRKLLSSQNPAVQESSVTAMLNLSIYDKNKTRIMEEEGCLEPIVGVLRFGLTTESQENAAATLFSLSVVHDYKKRIADVEGAVEALASLLRFGTPRGKKDAVMALFNISTHAETCLRTIESGAVLALIEALEDEYVSDEAAGVVALVVRRPAGAAAVGAQESAISGLIRTMRCGSPRGKENAVAALLELCRIGGPAVAERVLTAPALVGLLKSLLFTGTKRARRKAASLARVFQACRRAAALNRLRNWNQNTDSTIPSEVPGPV